MFRLLRLLPLLLVCLIGIGLYRGWFSFTSAGNDPDSQKINVSISVDKDKIKADAERAKEKISETVSQGVKELEARAKGPETK